MRSLRRAAAYVATLALAVGVGGPLAARAYLAQELPSSDQVDAAVSANDAVVVGLGDSVMSGYNCQRCTLFLDTFAAVATSGAGKSLNFGVPGLTTGLLVRALQPDDGRLYEAVQVADVIVICIGANDVAPDAGAAAELGLDPIRVRRDVGEAAAEVGDGLAAVLGRIAEIRQGVPAQVLVLTYWNVFADGQVGAQRGQDYVDYSVEMTAAVNASLSRTASLDGATVVDVHAAFVGADGTRDDTFLLTDDGEHPNQAGHNAIADAMLAAVQSR